jgi:hypothetical protein
MSELALATFQPKNTRGRTLTAGEESTTPKILLWCGRPVAVGAHSAQQMGDQ